MSDWYDEEYDDWDENYDEHDDWDEEDVYYDTYEVWDDDYWESDHDEPPTLRQRLHEWWLGVTWFEKCGTCGKWQVVFGRFVGNHKECIPF